MLIVRRVTDGVMAGTLAWKARFRIGFRRIEQLSKRLL